MDDQFTQLRADVDNLTSLFKKHKHLGTDLTQTLAPTSGVYGGYVDPNAVSAILPYGWTVSVSGGHVYTVTHNLGTTRYAVVAQAIDSNAVTYYVPFTSYNSNTFLVEFDDKTGTTAGVTDWMFVLTLI